MIVDLHSHTTASDGEFKPKELIDKAIQKEISVLAITDHDTIDSLDEAIDYAKNKEIEIVPGIEFSAKVDIGKMHILGLYINYTKPGFKKITDKLKKDRNDRNNKFIKMFNELGYDISIDDVKKYAIGEIIAKPHFAQVLFEKGYIKDIEEAYDNLFNVPPLNTINRMTLSPKETIEAIKRANGIAILAHPKTLKLNQEDLENKIKELISYGLDGIECYHSTHTFDEIKEYRNIAINYNLLISKGSDYHGPNVTPEIELGTGKNGNILNKEEIMIYEKLKNRLEIHC